MRGWLMLAKGDERQHGGNRGYSDILDSRYVWDTTVPNCGRPQAGDLIAIWDGDTLLGASVIERISETDAEKPRLHCPACNSTKIKKRKNLVPEYRCHVQKCRAEFNEHDLIEKLVRVKRYEADYPAAWHEFTGAVTPREIRQACIKPKAQHSIRELDLQSFYALIPSAVADQLRRFSGMFGDPGSTTEGGHVRRLARTRLGQGRFRARLLARFGSRCAITGNCPDQALEAAHLYSYASSGEHHDGGGLLLRRDIHRLFDLGFIAVNPKTCIIDISDELRHFEPYLLLQGKRLRAEIGKAEQRWLETHWKDHRGE